jgi:transaldolase
MDIEKVHITEAHFRHEMNNSKMATDLLSAGIRKFEEDGNKLKDILRKRIENKYKNDE